MNAQKTGPDVAGAGVVDAIIAHSFDLKHSLGCFQHQAQARQIGVWKYLRHERRRLGVWMRVAIRDGLQSHASIGFQPFSAMREEIAIDLDLGGRIVMRFGKMFEGSDRYDRAIGLDWLMVDPALKTDVDVLWCDHTVEPILLKGLAGKFRLGVAQS